MDKDIDYLLNRFKDYENMSINAAKFIKKKSIIEISKKDYFSLVLSGGKTPGLLYEHLAKLITDWSHIKVFWGDERFVPKNHPESNYNMAKKTLLSSIKVPNNNIFPIPTEGLNPTESAETYEKTIRFFFKEVKNAECSFDCILLGIGTDGHTASLFPGSPALEEKRRFVKDVIAPPYYSIRQRITLTLPIINRAKCVMFLVSGHNKKPIIDAMLNNSSNNNAYPAQLVKPRGKLHLFVGEIHS